MEVFVEFKINAAIAGGDGGTATNIHPIGRAPFLGTTIG